ncbi:MAG: hypothetical protein ACE5HS_05520 [bacterium]
MAAMDNQSPVWRYIFSILAIYLFAIASFNYYRYIRSTTDENIFSSTHSNVSITRSFPVTATDSILTGDLLLGIGLLKITANLFGFEGRIAQQLYAGAEVKKFTDSALQHDDLTVVVSKIQ